MESLDVTDRDAFLALADRYDISDIVHLAGTIPGDDPVSYFRTDTTGLFKALDAARGRGVRRFAVASSIGVYQGRTEIPWHEELDLPSAGLTATYVNAGNHSDGWLTTSDEIADHYARTATSPPRR